MALLLRLSKIGRTQCQKLVSLNSRSMSLMSMSPCDFSKYMQSNNLSRCLIFHDNSIDKPISSDETLFSDLSQFCLNDIHDYRNHEGIFLEVGRRTGALLSAFVWRTNRGSSCGGIRLWPYETMEDYLKDGMRLSYGMGVKSALAGLWAGGGKGIIASPGKEKISDPVFRRELFLDYGDFLSSLNGCYVGAEDAGVVVSDLDVANERTRFLTCISESKGGSGNPSIATGKGIVNAMEATLDYFQMGGVDGKKIVSQGCGNVARIIIDTLLDKGVGEIIASDIDEVQLDLAEKRFANKSGGRLKLMQVPRGETETLEIPCDILSPNALGNILTEDTIPKINAKIVCGAANNQLGKESDNQLLMDRGITYVVDFLCNRMGIVNCANEGYGRLKNDPALSQHFSKEWNHSIWNVTHDVLRKVDQEGITPVRAATEIAEKESLELHPIWPNRSKQIINDLVENHWSLGKKPT